MNSVVCTLFEGNYHYGVGGLVNSLSRNSFKGDIYAGYRGALPEWANASHENNSIGWPGAKTFIISEDTKLHFLPLTTNNHLTNYKPFFMLDLLNGPAKGAERIAYFDPDIVARCRWSFFEQWMDGGIALVHDIVDNDMPVNHPIRNMWKDLIHSNQKTCVHDINSYINAGFCGVAVKYKEFIEDWCLFITLAIGQFQAAADKITLGDKTHPFSFLDQDALNVSAMCTRFPISEMGPQAMDFIYGGWTMSHATGKQKPWNKNFLISFIKGFPPSLADKSYWIYADSPIVFFNDFQISRKKLSMKITSLLGRVYRKY